LSVKDLPYDEFKKIYSGKYPLCGKLGYTYDKKENFMQRRHCNKWECSICRPALKHQLYIEILKNVYNFDLQKHFVLTFGGKEQREKYTWWESYYYMNKQWNLFLKTIKRKYGRISFILFPRAHKDGYCHYHILTNKYMSWNWLNKKRKKYNLGFSSIQENKSIAEYMNNDFFKANEWFIPLGIKRFRTSRDIILRNWVNGGLEYAKNTLYFRYAKQIPDWLDSYLEEMQILEFMHKTTRIKKFIDRRTIEEQIQDEIKWEKENQRLYEQELQNILREFDTEYQRQQYEKVIMEELGFNNNQNTKNYW
jgi:hypothetical protein